MKEMKKQRTLIDRATEAMHEYFIKKKKEQTQQTGHARTRRF